MTERTEQGSTAAYSAERLLLVTADSHVGPRLVEDLRPYCDAKLLSAFDEWCRQVQAGVGTHYAELSTEAQEALRWNAQTEGHFNVEARLRDMNADGIAADVIFHGSQNLQPIPFDSQNFFGTDMAGVNDAELSAAGRHIYNRWLADFCSVEPERHVGLAQVPMWDIDATIREVEWAAEAGLRGVNFPAADGPNILGLDDPEFERFYAACAALRMPLTTHVSPAFPNHRYLRRPGYGQAIGLFDGMWWCRRAIWILTYAGVFERHPGLKLVITETPGSWLPQTVEDMDSLFEYIATRCRDYEPTRSPRSYIETNIWLGASFQSRKEAHETVENGYSDRAMWGSDYPHFEGAWSYPEPGVPSMVHLALANTYRGLPEGTVRRIVGLNAIDCYDRLDVDALAKVAERIDAPRASELFAEKPAPTKLPHNRPLSAAFRTRAAWS